MPRPAVPFALPFKALAIAAVLAAAVWIAPPASAAAAYPGLCPATLAGGDPAGFTLYRDGNPPVRIETHGTSSARLSSVRFSDGPPEEIAWLVPDTSTRKRQTWVVRASGTSQFFLSCVYGADAILLARPVEPGATLCQVDYVGNYVARRATCR